MTSQADTMWEVNACRAQRGGCRFALSETGEVKARTEQVLESSGWADFLRERTGGRILHHHRLSVVFAGCPNACSRPQIEDVGIIANLRPTAIGEECTGCTHCVRVCREGALRTKQERALVIKRECMRCGQCISACEKNAIAHAGPQFRFLVGGRVGRHPRWAGEVFPALPPENVAPALEALVAVTIEHQIGRAHV